MNLEITNNLIKTDLKEIELWLIEEQEQTGLGFYCNWHIIQRHFNDNEMYCVKLDDKVVGFLIYSVFSVYARIEVAEVHPAYRDRGIGKKLVSVFIDDLRESGVLVVKLESNPDSSASFWKSLGFIEMPEAENRPRGNILEFYLTLTPVAEDDFLDHDQEEVLEIFEYDWRGEREGLPTKVLTIERDQYGKLVKPIISPYSPYWWIRLRCGDQIRFEEPMQWFPFRKRGYDLLIVTEMKIA